MERFKSHDLSPSVSPKASRKVRLASRRGSNFDPNLHVGDVNPPSSPLSRQVSILYDVIFYEIIIFISLQSGSSFNRTTFKRSVCLFVCMSVCLYVCLSIFLSFCLSVYLFVCLLAYLSVCLFVCLSFCLSVCLSVCLFVCLFAYLSVCLSACLSVCLSICLSVCTQCCINVFT